MDRVLNFYNSLDNKDYLCQCIFLFTFLSFDSCSIKQLGLSVICLSLIYSAIVTCFMYPIIEFFAPTFMIKHLVFMLILLIIYKIIYHAATLLNFKKCDKYYKELESRLKQINKNTNK